MTWRFPVAVLWALIGIAIVVIFIRTSMRIAKQHDRRAIRTAFAAVVALACYLASQGPLAFIYAKLSHPDWLWTGIQIAYMPAIHAEVHGPEWFRKAMFSYRSWWGNLAS